MTQIPVRTLTAKQNLSLLTRAFGAAAAREMMKAEKQAGIKRPDHPASRAVIEF
jgi:hypothetical protein